MEKFWDIAVIGGGAAGLAAAIEAKRTAKTLSVLLLEKNACRAGSCPSQETGAVIFPIAPARSRRLYCGFLRNRASRYARRPEGVPI